MEAMSSTAEVSFKGRCAIITGGGRGIGRAVARDLAGRGAIVHLVARSDSVTTVAQEITASGGKAVAHIGSVADEAFAKAVVAAAERDGGPDILVNAAGILGEGGKFTAITMKGFVEAIEVNLIGTCNFIHAALPAMEKHGFGRIVNFAGGGAAYSYPNFTPYGTSKVALVRFTETLADEITTDDVTINIIAPGAVETDMLTEVRKRGGEVRTVTAIEEPVKLVRFLCSEASRHVSGRFIHARDRYEDASLFESKDMLKLRRIERR
jgi:NAD(P)-dependent dehydrogenase (short-subunit alcohol dehydrogenase family)